MVGGCAKEAQIQLRKPLPHYDFVHADRSQPAQCSQEHQSDYARRQAAFPLQCRPSWASAPDIANCSSAIRRSVDPERSRCPHFVSTGHATPMPSSTISILANVPASSMSGAKCRLPAINPVKSRTYSRRSPAKRTRSFRAPVGRTFFTIGMSLIIPFTFGIRSTTATTGSDSLPAAAGFSQDPTRRIAGNQFAIREADFRSKVRPSICCRCCDF